MRRSIGDGPARERLLQRRRATGRGDANAPRWRQPVKLRGLDELRLRSGLA
jgi:hypothetical protein